MSDSYINNQRGKKRKRDHTKIYGSDRAKKFGDYVLIYL